MGHQQEGDVKTSDPKTIYLAIETTNNSVNDSSYEQGPSDWLLPGFMGDSLPLQQTLINAPTFSLSILC